VQDDTDLPAAAGLRAHVKLSMILYEIINGVYGVASSDPGYTQTLSRVDKALNRLSAWQEELPPSLQLPSDGSIPDRARITLHLNYNQASTFRLKFVLNRETNFLVADNPLYKAIAIPGCQADRSHEIYLNESEAPIQP
jgi:hypothetical protein